MDDRKSASQPASREPVGDARALDGADDVTKKALAGVISENTYNDPVEGDDEFKKGFKSEDLPAKLRVKEQEESVLVFAELEDAKGGARGQKLIQFRGIFASAEEAQSYIDRTYYPYDPHVTHHIVDMWTWGWFPQTQQQQMATPVKYHNPTFDAYFDQARKQRLREKAAVKARRDAAVRASKAQSKTAEESDAIRSKLRQKAPSGKEEPDDDRTVVRSSADVSDPHSFAGIE